ncbi:DUF4811 domain-containing protein [Secundilactobacillus malefermentans]|uniref:DUF4811 domain-containing protein n=1 Tax=Secundilactobacillus malefermentans TaxID=176292 RepID=UPI0011C8EC49|nr:DUF4811 domain-containing protein [Secundilactobacillus malefermentans]QEA31690.1 DUF4811 domain-containing protein [Secundilactobacillus malefermentans]
MIVIFLFAGALIFAWSVIFLQHSIKKAVWVTVGFILVVGSVVLMTLNYNGYFGMKQIQTTETRPLATMGKNRQVLAYKRLGTQTERIYFYRDNPLDTKVKKTRPTISTVVLKRGAKQNAVKITRTYRVYRNEELRLLFANGVPNHQLTHSRYTFRVKSNSKVIEK